MKQIEIRLSLSLSGIASCNKEPNVFNQKTKGQDCSDANGFGIGL